MLTFVFLVVILVVDKGDFYEVYNIDANSKILVQTKLTIKRKAALFPSDSLFAEDTLFM